MCVPKCDSVKSVMRGRETARKAVKEASCLALFGALVFLAGCPNPGGGKTDPTKPTTAAVGDISVSLDENGPETMVTLPYKSQGGALPTSCKASFLELVALTKDCACSAGGVCTVGIRPLPETVGNGSFEFSLSGKNIISSNTGKANVKILEVSLVVYDGDGQVGTVGKILDKPLIVLARNSNGTAVPGVDVFWEPELAIKRTIGWKEEWLGSTASCKGKTDNKGLAQCTWTLGERIPVAKGNYKIRKVHASAFSANRHKHAHHASFTATINPGPATRLSFWNQDYVIPGGDGTYISPSIYHGPATHTWWRNNPWRKYEQAGVALGRAWPSTPDIPAAIVVFAQDEHGNAATVEDNITLTLAIKDGAQLLKGSTALEMKKAEEIGAVTDAAVGADVVDAVRWKQGLAIFSDVRLEKSGEFQLTVTAQGASLVAADGRDDFGGKFTVDPGPANKLKFDAQPGGARAGESLGTQPVVKVLDRFDNILAPFTGDPLFSVPSIELTAVGASGGVLNGTAVNDNGTATVNANGGVATFTGLSIKKAGKYTLTASSGGLPSIPSSEFTITPGDPHELVFAAPPALVVVGGTWGKKFTALVPEAKVNVLDKYENIVDNLGPDSVEVSVILIVPPSAPPDSKLLLNGNNPPDGPIVKARNVSGVSTFTGLGVSKEGTGYKLKAEGTAKLVRDSTSTLIKTLGSATSKEFAITEH